MRAEVTRKIVTAMPSKKELVYFGLREAIINHELAPGQIVNESEIAAQYGVSKSPVREALHELTYERYVNPIPRTGYMVTHITRRDIREAYHLRQLLEVEAAGLAVAHISEEQLAVLEESTETWLRIVQSDTDNISASTERTIAEGFRLNETFHLTIARASGNERLALLIEQLLNEMRRILAYDPYLVLPGSNADVSEHGDIVEALRRRDVEGARESMRRHMEKGYSRTLAHV
jgi:DNA-binding GntR family transcriptional regulator